MAPAEKRRRLSVTQSNGAHNLPHLAINSSSGARATGSSAAFQPSPDLSHASHARIPTGAFPFTLPFHPPSSHPSPPASPALPAGSPVASILPPAGGSYGGGLGMPLSSFSSTLPGSETYGNSLGTAQGKLQRPRPHSHHSNETATSAAIPVPGDELRIDGYRDVQVLSVHYDDVVACRAISIARGDVRVLLKLSLSAKSSVAAQFKAEASLLAKLRDAGVENISKIIGRESGRYGAMIIAANDDFKFWAEAYSLHDRPSPPFWNDGHSLIRAIDNAIRLVRLVASIHKAGVVHNSIRPTTVSNSLFNEVHLHDFSCAFHTSSAIAEASETTPIRERGMKEESLPYLAPECTGRVGEVAGPRSDFYSIGAALYEVFTGRTPFADALDPLEIVHAHCTRRPPLMTAIDPSVPHALSLIVAKLLEKSPEARYATSQGLIVDLERVRDLVSTATTPGLLERRVSFAPGSSPLARSPSPAASTAGTADTQLGLAGADGFVVGSFDEAAYFRLPPASQLFGREESIKALRASFEMVKEKNKPAVVVVKGHSGIGKTSLIDTLRVPVAENRAYFTTVKFDQIKSPVPFFAITQALSGLFRQLLAEPEASLSLWRRRLSRALGKEARVLAEVLPSLEHLYERGWLESQPHLPVLGAAEGAQRFQSLVQGVLRTFARAGKPLVIVFDDLQWSTSPDLTFIRSLAMLGSDEDNDPLTCKMANPMMILCLWRDNEVSPDHIVETQLLPRLPHINLTLTLAPLTLANVSSFVSSTLRNPSTPIAVPKERLSSERVDANVHRLSELILQKTQGSPLFVAQLLKSFNAEGLFAFNFGSGQWEYDLDKIASRSVSTNVVDLLLRQMMSFSPRAQETLKIAACLGKEEIAVEALAKAAGRTVEQVALQDLAEAVQEGLLIPYGSVRLEEDDGENGDAAPSGDAPTPESSPRKLDKRLGYLKRPPLTRRKESIVQKPPVPERYTFFHDRCQQAAYALIPHSTRSALHYQVGKRLVEALSEAELQEQIFDLVQQLNHGIDILSSVHDRDTLARYNFMAGQKANQSTAFEAARRYFEIAAVLLGAGGWVGQYSLMSEVSEALIEVEYSLTDYAAAQEYIRIFLSHAKDDVAKLRVYAKAIRCSSAVGDSTRAIDLGREGLALVGVIFPDTIETANMLVEETRSKWALTVEAIEALDASSTCSNPIALGCQAILAALVPPVYFIRIDLLGALSSLSLDLVLKHGIDAAGAFVLTLHAVLIHSKFKQPREALAYGKVAISFFEKHGGSAWACPALKVYSSHVAVWAVTLRETLPTFQKAVAFGIEYRDAEYLGFGCAELCGYSLLAGVSLASIGSDIERYAVLVRKYRHELSSTYIGVVQQVVLCLSGRASDACELDGEAFSLADYQTCSEKNYALTLLEFHMFRLMIAVFFRDAKRAEDSRRLGRENLAGGQGLVYTVIFQHFEAITLYDHYASLSPAEHGILEQTRTVIHELAVEQPDGFLAFHLWLNAEHARAVGDCVSAIALFDEAIAAARAQEMLHLSACMNERAALCLNNLKLATGYLLEAHAAWRAWGCLPKACQMETNYPSLFPQTSLPIRPITPSTPPLPSSSYQGLEYGSSGDSHAEASEHQSVQGWVNGMNGRHGSSDSRDGSHLLSEPRDEMVSTRSVEHSDIGRSHLATELDLRTVVSASGVLTSENSVDGVVAKLLNLALRTAGADYCLLVLNKEGTLCAEAIARSDSEVQHLRRTDAIDASPEKFPCSVIHYTARSKEMVINTLEALGDAVPDPYTKKHRPKSILALSLASQQRVVGVLYMENSQTTNAFTPDRLEILSLISGQAASTIEKARLVQSLWKTNEDLKHSQSALEASNRNLEQIVSDRTQELRENNALLKAEVAEKEAAQEIAESATAMKSQFLANMSHEIRTPFNAVVALSTLLLETQLSPTQADYVETIKNSSQELLVVINDILDYSKIELDHLELSSETVHLRNVLESSMDMVAERAATKSVEIALVIDEGDISILGDPTRLRQVVVNLLSNAVKFTANGEITVIASSEAVEPDENDRPRKRCRISVKDTGIGIAKENFSRLFRVYSQAEGAETSRNFGGTGLGLAISRKLSRLMNGDLTVDSELGKGSTFTVEWIVPAAPPPQKDPYSPQSNGDLIGRRALIVDANTTSRTVLKQLLKSFGLTPDAPDDVNAAYNVAVTAAEARKPHEVIILDAFLPEFGAQILLRRLRQKGLNAPAIALTRMGSPILEEWRALDCTYLIKPIKRNRLHHTLRIVFPSGEFPRPSSPAPASPAFPSNLGAKNPLSILCAEDNPINVKVITHLLKRLGYTSCDIAEDGAIAVEKSQKKRYDLILMDLNMPNKDGLEATRDIIELMPDPAQRPSIVCLTANAMSEDKLRCFAAGADGYLSKPVLVPDLVNALVEAFNRRSASLSSTGGVPPPPPLGTAVPFELELPTSRLGRGSRKNSNSSRGSLGTRSGPSSPSPEPGPSTSNRALAAASPLPSGAVVRSPRTWSTGTPSSLGN
ncbi:hypothetical protein JCM11641_000231 [Rhodosporidiobolus odoratus]